MTRKAAFLDRQSRDSATFTGSYQTLGSALSAPAVLIKIVNDSDQDIDISTDGVADHDYIPAGAFALYDLRANHGREYDYVFSTGTQFYVSGAVGTGLVYLVALEEV